MENLACPPLPKSIRCEVASVENLGYEGDADIMFQFPGTQ